MPDRKRNWDKTPEGQQYNNDYKRNHYDRVGILVPKGMKEKIDTAAREEGISTSAFIVRVLTAYMEKGTE